MFWYWQQYQYSLHFWATIDIDIHYFFELVLILDIQYFLKRVLVLGIHYFETVLFKGLLQVYYMMKQSINFLKANIFSRIYLHNDIFILSHFHPFWEGQIFLSEASYGKQ